MNRRTEANVHILEEHAHSKTLVSPDLADSFVITANAAAWNNTGALVEVIPAAATTKSFDVHWIDVVANNNAQYQLGIYTGGAGAEVLHSTVRFTRTGVFSSSVPIRCMTEELPAGTRVSLRIATGSANADTCDVSVEYHTY